MFRRIGWSLLAAALALATPAHAQRESPRDPWAGTWRGALTSPLHDDEGTPVTLTVVAGPDGYSGVVTGFGTNTEIRLEHFRVDAGRLIVEGATETEFGPLAFVYRLSRDDEGLAGAGHVAVGAHGFDLALELTRARRPDVIQPQVVQRIGYFAGDWRFEYTGGEYPPLSIGTRTGLVRFEPAAGAEVPFVRARVTGDVFGEAYEETWTIGFDETTRALVWSETRPGGRPLVSLGNWTSPIGITFLTAPVEADGHRYVLERSIRVTSDTAFSVTDEFSVDGGPFRRLGTGSYVRVD